ncbi:MAG TPA: GNAT family N-acetyltransferase [Bacteroidetes bacterium]|nr:GNAT family N-acetyltransferase [Bacteroidota bacterium]
MLIQRLKYSFKIAGATGIFVTLGYALANKVAYLKILRGMTLETSHIAMPFSAVPADYQARMLPAEKMQPWSERPEYNLSQSFLELAGSKGDRCLAIFHGEQLAAYGWYSDQPTRFSKRYHLTFDNRWMYMYRGYTHPDFRGQRLHAHGMAEAARQFTDAGYLGLISYVEANNFASLRSCQRLGYRTFGSIYVFELGQRFSRVFQTASCSSYGFGLIPSKDLPALNISSTVMAA